MSCFCLGIVCCGLALSLFLGHFITLGIPGGGRKKSRIGACRSSEVIRGLKRASCLIRALGSESFQEVLILRFGEPLSVVTGAPPQTLIFWMAALENRCVLQCFLLGPPLRAERRAVSRHGFLCAPAGESPE